MLDAKLLMMYLGLFRKRAVVALVLSIVVLVFVATVAYQFLAQGLRP
jgi:uncharacterized membrane protein YraQ (UPF0718 family)